MVPRTAFNACLTTVPHISFSMVCMHQHVYKSHMHTPTHTHTQIHIFKDVEITYLVMGIQ